MELEPEFSLADEVDASFEARLSPVLSPEFSVVDARPPLSDDVGEDERVSAPLLFIVPLPVVVVDV